MATRFYFPISGTSPLSSLAISATWELPSGDDPEVARLPTYTSKQDTALTTYGSTWPSGTSQDWCFFQFQSQPLDAVYTFTNGDLVRFIIGKCIEQTNAADTNLKLRVYVVSNDGTTERGVIREATGTTEFSSVTASTRLISATQLGDTFNNVIGDRVIIEFGVTGTTPSLETFSFRIGDPSAVSDFAFTSSLTTDLVSWLELIPTLGFAEAPDVVLTGAVIQTKHTVDGDITIVDVDCRLTGNSSQTKQTVSGTLTMPDVFLHGTVGQTKQSVSGTLIFTDVDVRLTGNATQGKHTILGALSVDFILMYGSSIQRKHFSDGILFNPISGEVEQPSSALTNYALLLDAIEYPLIRASIQRHRNYEKAVAEIPSALTQIVIESAPVTLEIIIYRDLHDGTGIQQTTLFTGTLDIAAISQNVETGMLTADGLAVYPTRENRLLQDNPSYVRDTAGSTSVRGRIDPLLVPGDVLRFNGVREIGVTKIIYTIDTNYQFMEAVSGF